LAIDVFKTVSKFEKSKTPTPEPGAVQVIQFISFQVVSVPHRRTAPKLNPLWLVGQGIILLPIPKTSGCGFNPKYVAGMAPESGVKTDRGTAGCLASLVPPAQSETGGGVIPILVLAFEPPPQPGRTRHEAKSAATATTNNLVRISCNGKKVNGMFNGTSSFCSQIQAFPLAWDKLSPLKPRSGMFF
jgi:hypothetical protein